MKKIIAIILTMAVFSTTSITPVLALANSTHIVEIEMDESVGGTLEDESNDGTLEDESNDGTLEGESNDGTLEDESTDGTLEGESTDGTLEGESNDGTLEDESIDETFEVESGEKIEPFKSVIPSGNLNDVHLVIDPGHGGNDPGAVANHNGVQVFESNLVLDASLRLRNLLEQTGMQVTMTRETDRFVSLADRARLANNLNADLFVSVHLNSHTTTTANGTEVFYFGPQGARGTLAEHSKIDVTNLFENSDTPDDDLSNLNRNSAALNRTQNSRLLAEKLQARLLEKLQLRDRGVKHGNFHVIRETNMAAVLTEAGFMSNPEELNLLASEEGLQLHAEALYLGILDYLVAQGYEVPDNFFNINSDNSNNNNDNNDNNNNNNSTRTGTTTARLNMRTGAGTNHGVIRTLASGQTLTILNQNGAWLHVRVGSDEGWVHSDWVRETTSGGNDNTNNNNNNNNNNARTGVTTARLNLRTGAGTNHGVIRTLANGQTVTILNQSGQWLQVRVGNDTGWVHSDWVRETTAGGNNNTNNNNNNNARTGVTTARLNLRTGAGTNHGVIQTLANGQTVTILNQNGQWLQVRAGNDTGWVHSDWIREATAGGNNNTSNNDSRTGVTTARLNLRTGAGTNYGVIRTLANGQTVTILNQNGQWLQVRVGNDTGWVHSDWVR